MSVRMPSSPGYQKANMKVIKLKTRPSIPVWKERALWGVAAAVFMILSIKPTLKALRRGYSHMTETANFVNTVGNYPQ